jgi:hypothetical protein
VRLVPPRPLLFLLVAACASQAPSLRLAPSGLPLDPRAPAPLAAPSEGRSDSASSRAVTLVVRAGGATERLEAPCRVGVWTTLERVRAREFVQRESWGRLGNRPPRLLARVTDQALEGVVARVRPEEDGSLSFVVEAAKCERGPGRTVAMYHGRRVALGEPRRTGYRFVGSAPPGFSGTVARWGEALEIDVGGAGGPPPPGTVRFTSLGESGFVAGERPAAEAFAEEWEPAEPFRFEADGVERMDCRLVMRRSAAGFRTSARGVFEEYGPPFSITRDG